MKILIYGSVISLSLLLTGCWMKPKPCVPKIKIVEKIVYHEKVIPDPSVKPKMFKFHSTVIEYNGEKYYKLTIKDGKLLKSNYEQLDSWGTENYDILKKLKRKE